MGCGALKEIDARHAEVKSMRTASAHRRSGVARAMLEHILAEATRRGYAAEPRDRRRARVRPRARSTNASASPCPPFEGYVEDPNSVFMTRTP